MARTMTLPRRPAQSSSQNRDSAKPTGKREVDGLPSMDNRAYYDPVSSPTSSTSSLNDSPPPSPHNIMSNSGNKLDPSARFMRKGKLYSWGPGYEEHRAEQRMRRRLKLCLEEFLPDAASDIGVAPPENIVKAEEKRTRRKRKREEEKEWILPHLASPSPPQTTSKLAPLLALPQTYVDIMTNPAVRHSLGDDSTEVGLQKIAGELLEGEKGLMQALGRLQEILRVRGADVPEHKVPPSAEPVTANGEKELPEAGPSNHLGLNGHVPSAPVPDAAEALTGELASKSATDENALRPLPCISETDNLWRVTQELISCQPSPTIVFSATPPDAVTPDSLDKGDVPTVTPVHRLFTCPGGMTLCSTPNPSHPNMLLQNPLPGHLKTIKYNLTMTSQCKAVDDALERISELLTDCNEYKERLEEARDRVSDVARARKRVWNVVKERAVRELDKEEKL